jgi:hypothetical protein
MVDWVVLVAPVGAKQKHHMVTSWLVVGW